MRRYQVIADGNVMCAVECESTARREARQYSRNTMNRCAHVFDLACTMIIYRARSGESDGVDMFAPIRRV